VEFRLAVMQDAEGITALINAAFRKAESFFIDQDRIDKESVQSLMAKGEFLISQENGALRGCVYLERRGDRAYLGLLSVDPKVQKGGIGSALMQAAEEHCAKSGCRFIDLRIVNLRTENHAFYSRRGYLETGTEPFPAELNPKLPCHFVNMAKALDQDRSD
jgi:N-acetylglutamate synthase-like GNAT family acetyltransferase